MSIKKQLGAGLSTPGVRSDWSSPMEFTTFSILPHNVNVPV